MASATSSPNAEHQAAHAHHQAPSLRTRIVLTGLALVLLVLLAQAGAMVLTLEQMEEELIDQILNQQIEYSIKLARHTPEFAAPNTPDMKLYRIGSQDTQDTQDTQDNNLPIPAALADLKVGNHEIHLAGRELHVAVRNDNGDRFVLAYDVEEHETRLHTLKYSLMASALFLASLLLATILLLARRLTGHLEQLATRVGNRPAGESFARSGMDREVLAIATALDHYDAARSAALARERNFTADVSHELRTPLTRIRTDAELLASTPQLAAPARQRANNIVASVDQINRLTTSLLLLAREPSPRLLEPVTVTLYGALDETWQALRAQHGSHASLTNRVPASATLHCDPALLTLVLRNILENALHHAPASHIVCALEGTRLRISDAGPGFNVDDLPCLFDQQRRGQSRNGYGLGLPIIHHVAQASGWHISAENAPTGGAVVEIDFGGNLQTTDD